MDQTVAPKILALQALAKEDPEYQALVGEYMTHSQRLVDILPTLTTVQRDAVVDYFGVTGAMHLRLLELALQESL